MDNLIKVIVKEKIIDLLDNYLQDVLHLIKINEHQIENIYVNKLLQLKIQKYQLLYQLLILLLII